MRTVTRSLILACLLLVIAAVAQAQDLPTPIKGERKREVRPVQPFTSIDVGGACDVYLTIGQGYAVEVETLTAELADLRVLNAGDLLTVAYTGKVVKMFNTGKNIDHSRKIYITCPTLEGITLHGATDLTLVGGELKGRKLVLNAKGSSDMQLNLDVEELLVTCQGASDVKLSGSAGHLAVNVQGSSDVSASRLICANASVTAQGSSDVKVHAKAEMQVFAKGSSDVTNTGPGKTVVLRAKGSSDVRKASW